MPINKGHDQDDKGHGIFCHYDNSDVMRELRKVLEELHDIRQTQTEILKAIQALQIPKKMAGIHFQSQEKGVLNMPLQLPVGKTDEKYFVNALDANGNPGATLAAGQLVAVVSADPSVVLTPDAAPGVDPVTGVQSIASGGVVDGPAAVIGNPVTITATLTAADGVTIVDTETDTVTPLVGTAAKIGVLFEDTGLTPPPAGGKRK